MIKNWTIEDVPEKVYWIEPLAALVGGLFAGVMLIHITGCWA